MNGIVGSVLLLEGSTGLKLEVGMWVYISSHHCCPFLELAHHWGPEPGPGAISARASADWVGVGVGRRGSEALHQPGLVCPLPVPGSVGTDVSGDSGLAPGGSRLFSLPTEDCIKPP